MFDQIRDQLSNIFKNLRKKGKLSEQDVDDGLREIRRALLEADVSLPVVKKFITSVKEKAVGERVVESLQPVEVLIKVVHDELVDLLGGNDDDDPFLTRRSSGIHKILVVGLQGSGKTTFCAKLSNRLKSMGQKPMMAACDLQRPAAVEQLAILGKQVHVPVITRDTKDPLEVAKAALSEAAKENSSVLIFDTAGRLAIDETLMTELAQVKELVQPTEILLVIDAMIGQDAVNVAQGFHDRIGVTGVVLAKFDSDTRAGAALTVRAITNVPIRFVGVSEKIDGIEPFHPSRVAGRILGMGDVVALVEKVQSAFDEADAKDMQKSLLSDRFTIEHFMDLMNKTKKIGSMGNIAKLMPGVQITDEQLAEGETQMKVWRAIMDSMTKQERRNPKLLNANRRKRIAKGSGTSVQDINIFIREFSVMQEMMKKFKKTGLGALRGLTGH